MGFSNAERSGFSFSVAFETGQPDVIADVAHGVVQSVNAELLVSFGSKAYRSSILHAALRSPWASHRAGVGSGWAARPAFMKGSPRCRRPSQPCRGTACRAGPGWAFAGVGPGWAAHRAFVKGSPRCRRPFQPCRVTARRAGPGLSSPAWGGMGCSSGICERISSM